MDANTLDSLQWGFMALLTAGGVYLAFKKSGPERYSLEANANKAYAEAAQIKAEENVKLEKELAEVNMRLGTIEKERVIERLALIERKKYRVVVEFTIGDNPEPGKVEIMQIVDNVPQNIPVKAGKPHKEIR